MQDLCTTLETYLLTRRDWVSASELSVRFGIRTRQLRALGDHPGMASSFAICSDKGLKHVACASTSEWLRFKHRLRRHGIGELIRVRDLSVRRQAVTRSISRPPLSIERDSGQILLPIA